MTAYRRPESVLVIVHTGAGDVLLLRRVQPFAFWQSVTGTLGPGESPRQCAVRELFEETGLTSEGVLVDAGAVRVFEIDPRWRARYAPGVTHNTEHEFRYRLHDRLAIEIDRREHSAYRWLPVDEAAATVWSWTNQEALERLADAL